MRLIINRGIQNQFSRLAVYRNGQEISACQKSKDFCDIDARDGDLIKVNLKFFGGAELTAASFVCHGEGDVFYVSLAGVFKRWEALNYKFLPFLCLFFLVLRAAINTAAYDWFCTGMIVMLALSLMCYGFVMLMPSYRKRMFKLEKI